MLCEIIDGKKYSRADLNEIAKVCKIKNKHTYNKSELYELIKKTSQSKKLSSNCVRDAFKKCNVNISNEEIDKLLKLLKDNNILLPTNITDVDFKKTPQSSTASSGTYIKNNFEAFAEYFNDELMGFVQNNNSKPLMRAFVPGGYGLRMLFEHKYKKKTLLKPGDLDITLSIYDSTLSATQCKSHILNKCKEFIHSRPNSHNYHISAWDFPPVYNPLLKMKRFSLISITYKGDEFVDMAITDREIKAEEIDKSVSSKCNLPIKHDDGYLFEYFQIIYMENVPGVDHYCYLKRNPVTGKFSCKGVKDIDRVTLLCKLSKSVKYKTYCDLVNQVSADKLKNMTQSERDKVFLQLRSII